MKLPGTAILPVHRSDSSGTSYIFTNYLKKASPEWASIGAGKSVNWPGGLAGKGNDAVSALKEIAASSSAFQLARIHAIWALGQIGAKLKSVSALDRTLLETWVRTEHTGVFARRAWYLYELLTATTLDVDDVPPTGETA